MTCEDCKFYKNECESHSQLESIGMKHDMKVCEFFVRRLLSAGSAFISRCASLVGFCRELSECELLLETDDGIPVAKCEKCLLEWLRKPVEEGAK